MTATAPLPTDGPDGGDWRRDAACRDEEPELFFPPGRTDTARVQIEAAKSICATCPVRAACLRFALDTDQREGIWGGRTARERRTLRHARTGRNDH